MSLSGPEGPWRGPFHAETIKFESVSSELPVTTDLSEVQAHKARLNKLVDKFNSECPYVGQQVAVEVDEAVLTIDELTGESNYETGPVYGRFAGIDIFMSDVEDREYDLGLRLETYDWQGNLRDTKFVDMWNILDIQLQDTSQPFRIEEARFRDFADALKQELLERIQLSEAVSDDAIDDLVQRYIEQSLAPNSITIGSDVDLLICDESEVEVFTEADLPIIVPGKKSRLRGSYIDIAVALKQSIEFDEEQYKYGEEDEDEAVEPGVKAPDDPASLQELIKSVKYRGNVNGRVLDFSYTWDNPYEDEAKLSIVVELPLDHEIVKKSGGQRFATILIEDISYGKLISGPAFN